MFDLGLDDAAFWRLTPRKWVALCDRLVEGRELVWYQTGVIAAAVTNAAPFRKRRRPARPEDFVPRAMRRRRPKQTTEQMVAIVEQLNRAFGGRDKRRRPAHPITREAAR